MQHAWHQNANDQEDGAIPYDIVFGQPFTKPLESDRFEIDNNSSTVDKVFGDEFWLPPIPPTA